MRVKGLLWLFFIVVCVRSLFGQAAFSLVRDEVCREEGLAITNISSAEVIDFEWDFCMGDFENEPTVQNNSITGLGNGFGLELIYFNNEYYGFVADKSNNAILRLDYGVDPSNSSPAITDLGNPGNLLVNPEGLTMVNLENNWYGVVAYQDNGGSLTRLDFGNSPLNTPTATDLGSFGFGGRIRSVKFLTLGNNLYLTFSYYNDTEFVIVDYGDSFDNTINLGSDFYVTSLPGLSLATGFDYEQLDNGDHAFYIVSIVDETVMLLNYGNDLLTTPTQTSFELPGLTFNFGFEIIREAGNYYGIISSDRQPIKIYDLGDLENPTQPIELSYTTALPTTEAFRLYRYNGKTYIKGYTSGTEYNLEFAATCQVSEEISNDEEPAGIEFTSSGEEIVWLQGFDTDGNVRSAVDTITVTSDIAPPISYIKSASQCVDSPTTFTPTNTGLTSYSWDFDDDGVEDSNAESPTFDFSSLGTGTYMVRLDVNDGTCDNFYEETITIYDPPPAPDYTFAAPRFCTNASIDFTNNTPDATYEGPLTFTWDFNGEGTANTRDATFAFPTPGDKTVTLTSGIPGCEEVTQQVITIDPGPTAGFFAPTVCQGDVMSFTNTSTAAVNYSWDFGDGFLSSSENPDHTYTSSGNFFVTLTATDAVGCEDTEVIEVAVSSNPDINFDFDIPCTKVDGIQFTDLTTVVGADAVAWSWFVDDELVSTEQSPQIAFSSEGVKNVRLDVQSSNGCESSYNEDINILAAPVADFTITIGCQGEASSFEDNTTSVGNPVVSWLWTVEGVNYGTQDIFHVFNSSGVFDVTLEVTGQNFCSESITKSVEILPLPDVKFNIEGSCDNQVIRALDESIPTADPIVSRRWRLDGSNMGNGTELFLEDLAEATYTLALEVETEAGCVTSASRSIEINEAPEAAIAASRTYGVPNDAITFTNTSSGAVSYQWLLNGEVFSTSPSEQTLTFLEEGIQRVQLVATNILGCNDTTTQDIRIAIPEVDLSIESLELVRGNTTGRIFMEIRNESNLPVELTEAAITLENTLSVTEQISAFIDVGETALVNLAVGIPLNISEPAYFCVRLNSPYVDFPDITPLDNEKCLTIQPLVQVENPFPNPTLNRFEIRVISPSQGLVGLRLISASGQEKMNVERAAIEGLNTWTVDVDKLSPGLYFLLVDLNGASFQRKLVKQ